MPTRNVKKCLSRFRNLTLRRITMCLVLLTSALLVTGNLISCRTLNQVSSSDTAHLVQHHDSVILHDSIYIREYARGDTVYVDRIRDRWKERLVVMTDTLIRCDTVVQHIETPATIPRYYKRVSAGFWVMLAGIIGLLLWRIIKWIYLKR